MRVIVSSELVVSAQTWVNVSARLRQFLPEEVAAVDDLAAAYVKQVSPPASRSHSDSRRDGPHAPRCPSSPCAACPAKSCVTVNDLGRVPSVNSNCFASAAPPCAGVNDCSTRWDVLQEKAVSWIVWSIALRRRPNPSPGRPQATAEYYRPTSARLVARRSTLQLGSENSDGSVDQVDSRSPKVRPIVRSASLRSLRVTKNLGISVVIVT